MLYDHLIVVHAEANAIMHKTCIDLKGCTIYVTLFPCNECAKLIIQSGIERIYFLEGEPEMPTIGPQQPSKEEKEEKFYVLTSRRLLEMAGYSLFLDTSTVHSRSK
jgi:deoxycytidylate deaminase